MKFKAWAKEWLELSIKGNVKLKTFNSYRDVIFQRLIPFFCEAELEEISYAKMLEFILKIKESGNMKTAEPLSANTLNHIMSVLKNCMDAAVECGYLQTNPCAKIKKIKGKEKSIEVLSVEEQRKLEQFLKQSNKSDHFGILLALYTGLRIGELLSLTWEDIDFKSGVLYVRKTVSNTKDYNGNYVTILQAPKTASSARVVPLPKTILQQLKQQKQKDKTLPIINHNGKPISIRGYQYALEAILKRLEIKKIGFHALRHTFATRAMECGFDVKTLSEIMGHSSVAITMNRYAHSLDTQKKLMMEKLNKFYTKNVTY